MSRLLLPVVVTGLCWSCGGSTTDLPQDTAGREAFIGAYLDLRMEALSLGSNLIGDELRDSVLTVYDVTEQDLRDFVDVHGEDVQFMHDLWTDIDTRLTERIEIQRDQDAEAADREEPNEDGDGGV
jgi:hypothetical protein